MRDSSKAALGGMIAALSIVVMLITYISPLLVYTAPPFAGLLLIVIVYEMGFGWACGTYAAISLLSVFLIADKEAALFFVMFFGYYPILKQLLTLKIKKQGIRLIVAFIIFNLSLACTVFLGEKFFSVDYSELTNGGKAFFILFWGLMNAVFFVYDFLTDRLSLLYRKKLQKKVRRLFKR